MSRSKRKHPTHADETPNPHLPDCKVGEQVFLFSAKFKEGDQPSPATVAHVNDDGTVNVGYLDKDGFPKSAVNVCLTTAGCEEAAEGCLHCRKECPETEDKPADPDATDLETT